MGNNLMGVEAGAWAYFGKTASQLTAGEAALLAALVKAPGTLNPYGPHRERLLARQRWVLSRMAQLGYLSPQELQARQSDPVRFRGRGPRPPAFPFEAPHFVNLVLAQEKPAAPGSQRIRTTLDLPLQRRAQAIVNSHRPRLLKAGASQAAAVIVANRSREVLALVGSCAYGPRDQGFNNGAAAWRSPGSTLKPFLYAQALDQGFTPASVLEDVERRYRTPRGEFIPANFDRVAHGPISFREALGNSLNLSTVHLLNLMGTGDLLRHPGRAAPHQPPGIHPGALRPGPGGGQPRSQPAATGRGLRLPGQRRQIRAPAVHPGCTRSRRDPGFFSPGGLHHQRHLERPHGPGPHLRRRLGHESALPHGHQDRDQHPLPGLVGRGLHPGVYPGGVGGQFQRPAHG